MAAIPQSDRERLRQHFLAGNSPDRWEMLWHNNYLPWDRGAPNPALIDILNQHKSLFGKSSSESNDGTKTRKRALVPGCGRGYDVMLLASFGYDTVGVDGSETAITAAQKLPQEHMDKYQLQPGVQERGTVTYILADFFSKSWEGGNGKFDIIYDYTFLCALPPAIRPAWAQRMVELLSPTGRLVCLEYPTYKEPNTGGPPFGLQELVYLTHLGIPGGEVAYDDDGYVVPGQLSNGRGLVRLERFQPERTHPAGEGTDWISVWGHQ